MTDLRTAARQALEALLKSHTCPLLPDDCEEAITALRAALAQQAEPAQDQDVEDAIEAAYWQFDCRKKGLNEWAFAPQSERDAFKAEARKLVRGYFPTRQAQDTKREMLAVADAFIRGKRAALAQQAEPTGKKSLQVESVVAENATTQQQIEQTPPSEYRRGYWAGFAIGKREGRIEAEDALAQQAEPVASGCRVMVCGVDCHPGDQHCNNYCTGKADDPPAATTEQAAAFAAKQHRERPSCDECGKSKEDGWALYCVGCLKKAFAPPQRKPLTVTKGLPRKLPEDNDD